ncbi:glycosyltransferase family 2 protein [Aureispira anguillae]|uniref:Glycosyltransferase n=1 Tax=Aureispira anguillae TaxID=2864201 RepID=A0A915YL56_9BACT|nr:glycosyltransferase [Aureispira anguillae]BDS15245.1 glycosyltransferase [Aureispira anguillae]
MNSINNHNLVSVIIPAYKAGDYIEETIRGVLAQTHRNFELIIVDDGSPDHQAQIIEPLAASDTRIQYIKQKNGGVSSARNHGYQCSKGDYLAFLDADDIWLPQNLEKKLAKFATDPALGLVHSDMAIMDGKSQLTGETKSGKEGYILDDLLSWNGTCVPTPSSILVKRTVVETVGGFDLALSNAADQEFFFRVAQKYKIGRVPEVTWWYRVHDNNMHSNIPVMEKDALLAYQRAEEHQLFKSKSFRNFCFANMYMIMGASWWGDGNNKKKGLQYLLKAIWTYPPALSKVAKKLFS